MIQEEIEFRKDLSSWLVENRLIWAPDSQDSSDSFRDKTEDAVLSLVFEYPEHVKKITFEFLNQSKFENNNYVTYLKNKILAHSL
jgi:hypothetical protein